ncbi:MAG: phenylalanine--tRNA ligase subunit beta [Gammaproteobacteria bacterium]
MKFPESWLRSFCNPEWSTDQLAERLTMAGLEVEEVTSAAPPFSGVVVGHVLSVTRHPNADKLNVCEVDTGSGVQSIVCGAPNVTPGVRVPCALPGAVLPGGFAIRPVTMRGVESKGMLCSARELGLSEDHGGLLLLPADAPVGADIRKYLQLEDQVFLLKLTPNLAHCFGVQGIAREVAALSGAALSVPSFAPVAVTLAEKLPVRIEAPDLCGRFSGRVIRGVNAKAPTPEWMKRRLERAGQRPISALVDISNYVMLELGRPSHVFDLQKIAGGLQVRWGRTGERLELLNGQVIELDPQVGVIADASGQVESLAGIMGGASTAVSLDTTAIYVEAAFWWPAAIAGRARRYNFSTDAAQRFERGVDPASTVDHLEYLSRLILEICGGQAAPVDDTITGLPERNPVTMRIARARKVIGIEISEAEIAQAFQRLQLPARRDGDHFVVTPPSYRFDLQIEEDLIEEVVRLWGYERLPVRPPRASLPMLAQPEARRSRFAVRRAIAARDYQEVIGYSFVASELDRMLGGGEPIRLLNPIAAQMDVMRTTLWGGLVETLRANLNRRATRVRLFEAGRVFAADPSVQPGPLAVNGVRQPEMLAGMAYGPVADEQWGMPARPVDFFDVKADVQALFGSLVLRWERAEHPALHPGRSARLILDGRPVGWLGTLHPAVQQALELPQAPVLFEVEMDALVFRPVPSFEPVSKFPPVVRDLALVVDQSIPAQRLLDEVEAARAENASGGLLRNVILFDEYRGKGLENKEKSLAIRLWMQDTQRTLNDAEVNDLIAAIVDRVGRSLGARLRSGA